MIPLKREIAEFQSASSINSEWLSVDLSRILFAISRAYKSQFCFERVAHQNQDQFWNSIKIILSSLLTNQYEFDSNGRNEKKIQISIDFAEMEKTIIGLALTKCHSVVKCVRTTQAPTICKTLKLIWARVLHSNSE